MRRSDRETRATRALDRAIARAANRPSPAARRRSRGQTLIIFALAFTALLGFMGMAIDSVRVYDLYARMQRAAEAGALAGVIYMPTFYATNIPQSPFDNAVCRALQETSKNGFGAYCNPASQPANITSMCPTTPSTIEIAVCAQTGLPHDLKVYITENINLVFLSALGVGQLRLTASAQAEYIPPVNVAIDPGSPGGTGTWGTFGSFSGASCPKSGGAKSVRCWGGNINGPGELKEQGDPLVTCEEGPSGPPTLDTPVTTLTPPTNITYVGMPSNHPQYPGSVVGSVPGRCAVASNPSLAQEASANGDTANVFTGPTYYGSANLHTGYAYYAYVPPNDTENLWVWNAPFDPASPKSCNGRVSGPTVGYDTFYYYNCTGSTLTSYTNYPGTSCALASPAPNNTPYTCEDNNLPFAVTYSVYPIPNVNSPTGSLAAALTALPYEVGDHAQCGSNGLWRATPTPGSAFAGAPSGCLTSPCAFTWCPVGNHMDDQGSWAPYPLSGGATGQAYRVMVVAADYGDPDNFNTGYGGHAYSLKLCPTSVAQSGVSSCAATSGAGLSGWTLSDALFVFPGNGGGTTQVTEYPLGNVGAEFAGRTLDIQLFDPGDLSGTNSSLSGQVIYAVAPPTTSTDACAVSTSQLSAAGYPTSSFAFPYSEYTAPFSAALTGLKGADPSIGYFLYNGVWADEQIKVPATYTGGNWTLCAIAPLTNDFDVVGIKVQALGQSPVHLVGG